MIGTVLLTLACGLLAGMFHHTFGVAPVLGAILCAACFLKPKELFVVGVGGIFLREIVIGLSPFTPVRLAGMFLVVAAIAALRVRLTLRSLLLGLLVSSPIFHLTLAVGDWATGTCAAVPQTPQGLLTAIAGAVPYFQRSFVGDTLFTGLFVGAYILAAYACLSVKERAFSFR